MNFKTMRKATWFNLPGKVEEITKKITESPQEVGGGLEGTQYIFVPADGTDVENAQQLQDAYNEAKTMSPGAANRITVIAAPGNYNFSSDFVMDTQYIDLVSLDGNRSIIFNGSGTISITANDVFVKGVDVLDKTFTIGNNLNLLKVENCKGGFLSFGDNQSSMQISGTFINCEGGDSSFGGTFASVVSGTFINCKGGNFSFSINNGAASGTFTDCVGGDFSFGFNGTASGTFTNCVGGAGSFQPLSGILSFSKLLSNALPDSNTLNMTGGVIVASVEFANTFNDKFIAKRPEL